MQYACYLSWIATFHVETNGGGNHQIPLIPALCSGESRLNLPDLSRGLCHTKAALPLDERMEPGLGALPYAHRYVPQDACVPEHSLGNTIRAQFT